MLFLDADDRVDPQGLAVMAEACQKHGWAAAYGKFRYARPDGSLVASAAIRRPAAVRGLGRVERTGSAVVDAGPAGRRPRRRRVRRVPAVLVRLGEYAGRLARRRRGRRGGRVRQLLPHAADEHGPPPAAAPADLLVTLRQMHAPDPRVPSPDPRFANGADPALLAGRIADFTVYAASLAVATGEYEPAVPLLDTIAEWPRLSPETTAAFLFYAICFARCEGAEASPGFWPEVAPAVDRLLAEIERQQDTGAQRRGVRTDRRDTEGKITRPSTTWIQPIRALTRCEQARPLNQD